MKSGANAPLLDNQVQQVSKFAALRDAGIITQAEFMQQTAMVMGDNTQTAMPVMDDHAHRGYGAVDTSTTPGRTGTTVQVTKGADGMVGLTLGAGNIVTEVYGALAASVHVGDQITSIEGAVCPQSVDETYDLLRGAPTTFGIGVLPAAQGSRHGEYIDNGMFLPVQIDYFCRALFSATKAHSGGLVAHYCVRCSSMPGR